MALVKTMRNIIDQEIDTYPVNHNGCKPRFILLSIDDYFKFRDELRALDLYFPPKDDMALMTEIIKYRELTTKVCLDLKTIEVVG